MVLDLEESKTAAVTQAQKASERVSALEQDAATLRRALEDSSAAAAAAAQVAGDVGGSSASKSSGGTGTRGGSKRGEGSGAMAAVALPAGSVKPLEGVGGEEGAALCRDALHALATAHGTTACTEAFRGHDSSGSDKLDAKELKLALAAGERTARMQTLEI